MRVIIQRVLNAGVKIDGNLVSSIKQGLLVLAGYEEADTDEDISWICSKIVQMRIFNDSFGVMNCSLKDVNGEILLVSQFTLHASTRKGNRPSYIRAAKPAQAIPKYERTIQLLTELIGKPVSTGQFGADMKVELVNDGPVTIVIDSKGKE